MGVKAISWAFEQPLAGNEKTVLLALADHARDDGTCWPGFALVAQKAYVSEKTVQRIIRKLEEGGYLERVRRQDPDGGRRPDLIRLSMGANGQGDRLPKETLEGGQQDTPRAGGNEPLEPSVSVARASTPSSKPVTYRSRRVPKMIVDGAEELLVDFCEAVGRQIGSYTAHGDASPALRQIIGAMLSRPEVRPDTWAEGVRNTVENPPGWINGRGVQIGDVFGERAAEWALSNQGKVAAKTAKDPEKQQRVEEFMSVLRRATGEDAIEATGVIDG